MDKGKVKVWHDDEQDIVYISLKEGVAVDSEEIEEGIRIEYGVDKEIVGIELSKVSVFLAQSIAKHIKENLMSLSSK